MFLSRSSSVSVGGHKRQQHHLMTLVIALFAALAVFSVTLSPVRAQPGMDRLANLDPEMLRQAMLQFPGVTSGCVDSFIQQLTSCRGYFDEIGRLFPDLQAADGNQLLSYVMSNLPDGACCGAIDVYNSAKCICEAGTLPMAQQFPARYWGMLEAGRCTSTTSAVVTPQMC